MKRGANEPATVEVGRAIREFLDANSRDARRIIVAISGGPDSVVLSHALARLPHREFRVEAVHVNHHLRGRESDEDEVFVRDLCESLELPVSVIDGAPDPDDVRRLGLEAAARRVRYASFASLRAADPRTFVATAHQRDDQAETVLLRLVTGRGTWRLAGIQPVSRNGVIRPLLAVGRATIDAYLKETGIVARTDSSNREPRFLRNRIRHELLPLIADWNPQITAILADTAALERERDEAFGYLLDSMRRIAVDRRENESIFDRALLPENPFVRRVLLLEEILRLDPHARDVSAADLARIDARLSVAGRTQITRRIALVHDGSALRLKATARADAIPPFELPIDAGGSVVIHDIALRVTLARLPRGLIREPASADRYRQVLQIPAGTVPSFTIRNRRRGDRFKPLGMRHEKNLSDFLIDRRIPKGERESIPLLVFAGTIAWIAGVEVSEDFKLMPGNGVRVEAVAERLREE